MSGTTSKRNVRNVAGRLFEILIIFLAHRHVTLTAGYLLFLRISSGGKTNVKICQCFMQSYPGQCDMMRLASSQLAPS